MRALIALLTAAALVSAAGSVPQMVNYQGRLTDAAGNPVPDGNYQITFSIYDSPAGITVLWTSGPQMVPVGGGLFSYQLGSAVPLPDDLFSVDTIRYLGIKVGDDPEIVPRTRLISMPYAYQCLRADTAAVALSTPCGWVDDGAVVRLESPVDLVGIGTETPAARLHVFGDFDEIMRLSSHAPLGGIRFTMDNTPKGMIGYGDLCGGGDPGGMTMCSETQVLQLGDPHTGVHLVVRSGYVGIGSLFPSTKLNVVGFCDPPEPVVLVEQTGGGRGLRVNTPDGMCALVAEAGNHGLRVIEAGRVDNPTADGIHVMHAWHHGVYVDSVEGDGVHVDRAVGWAGYFDGSGYFGGRLGVGSSDPGEKLDVAGNLRFTEEDVTRKIYVEKSDGVDEAGRNLEVFAGEHSDLGAAETIPGGDLILHGGRGMGLAGGDVYVYGGSNTSGDTPEGDVILACPYGGLAAGGNVGIGTNQPTNILTVQQNSSTDPIADAWTIYSSKRWKKDIKPIPEALEKVQQLRGVCFRWKESERDDIGMIAEEVGRVIPELVAYEENGIDAKSIDYARVTAVLVEAVKEQQRTIEELQTAVKLLTARLDPEAKADRELALQK